MGNIIKLPLKQDPNKALGRELEKWAKSPEGQAKIKAVHKMHWESLTFTGKIKDLWLKVLYMLTN